MPTYGSIRGGQQNWRSQQRAYRARKKFARSRGARRQIQYQRRFVAGRNRTGGYYGRFGAASGELKFFDVTLDDAVVAATGTITDSLNKIAQGTTESERDGRKCVISHIGWRFEISLPEIDAVATPASGDVLRIILYCDKQANGATAAVTDILELANYQSFNNLANTSRFRTLYDRVITINYATLASDNSAVVSQANVIRSGAMFKKVKVPLEFSATTGAMSEIRSNNLGVLLISRNGLCAFNSHLRLRFRG